MRIIVVGLISAVTLGGCGNTGNVVNGATTNVGSTAPSTASSPSSVDAQHDRLQPAATVADGGEFQLLTHCGINGIMIADRWWQAEPPLDDGQGNPSAGWGNPYQPGVLRLVDEETAVFDPRPLSGNAASLPSVTFHRTAGTDYPFLCS